MKQHFDKAPTTIHELAHIMYKHQAEVPVREQFQLLVKTQCPFLARPLAFVLDRVKPSTEGSIFRDEYFSETDIRKTLTMAVFFDQFNVN